MDFQDISARMKANREAEAAPVERASADTQHSYAIRARMIGVLIRDARVDAGRSLDDCAQALGIAAAQVEAWEFGDATPTLPQLEILAAYLDVPVSHFWGSNTLERERTGHGAQSDYLALRDRMIGLMLRQAREEQGLTVEALSVSSGLSAERISRYELGDLPLPMHELTVLANSVRKNLSYFLESSSYIGEELSMREEWKRFSRMPEALRQFAANPLNAGFLEIAMVLSELPADRLRRIGESMLNITM
jgi:transcriptional regulator with XRE-family HTH domain